MAEAHEELAELREHAEEAKEHRMAQVSLTMAVLAVLVAVVTLLGHRAHTEEIMLQTKLTDQWAYFQAKNVRRDLYQVFLDQLELSQARNAADASKAKQKYEAALEHEHDRQKDIQDDARKLENEINTERRRANRFDLAEGILEAALVITSITLLTRRRWFWYFGSAFAVVGIVVVAMALTIHP